jgi:hypothetical protein
VSRGATSGVVTTSSPVTNEVRVTGPIADDLDFTPAPKGAVNDSVLNVHFTEDPRAAFYIVELNDASDLLGVGASASLERRTRGIASPLLPGSRSLHSVFTLMPRGTGLAGFDLTITSRQWPQAFHIRVTAYDYDGQLINRVNDYLRVDARDGNLILQGYEPLGGAVQLLDPYPSPTEPVPTPPVFSRAQVRDIYLAIGINTAPVLQSNLKFQATAGTAPPREIFNQLGQHERFSVETLKASVAQARQVLDNPPTGPLRGGRSVRARGR